MAEGGIVKDSGFKDLIVWQKAMKLTTQIYMLTKKLPKDESYGLISQMRRSAVSIASNIAEGRDRDSEKEFAQFLSIARGSKSELETQLHVCVNVGYLTECDLQEPLSLINEVSSMLTALIKKFKTAN